MKRSTQVLAQAGVAQNPWLVLLRPRIAVMVMIMALLGAAVVPGFSWGPAIEAALLITLVTGSASILNQVLERDTDALMERTRMRPLVTGELSVGAALIYAVVLGAVGVTGLALRFNLLSALLSMATLVIYVAIYTPVKRVSTTNTVVGAISGAAPPLLGYAALAGNVGPWAWCMFAVIFAWQFPHFFAIAWIYREDYRRAGFRMLPTISNAKGLAGRHGALYALALVPVALLPISSGLAGWTYGIGVTLLSLLYLGASIRFALHEDHRCARSLVLVSLLYLPLWAVLILIDPFLTGSVR
jgi:protoheme IX farnesyltransferase